MTCYEGDAWIEEFRKKLKEGTENNSNPHLTQHQHILRYKNRICVGGTGDCRKIIIKELHDSSLGGPSGITDSYQRIKRLFYWPNLKEEVHRFIQHCDNCQINKPEHLPKPGLLQPLPIPERGSVVKHWYGFHHRTA